VEVAFGDRPAASPWHTAFGDPPAVSSAAHRQSASLCLARPACREFVAIWLVVIADGDD